MDKLSHWTNIQSFFLERQMTAEGDVNREESKGKHASNPASSSNGKDGGFPHGGTTRRGSGLINSPYQLLARF